MSKGIDAEELEVRGRTAVRRAPVTYETPMRGYLREWKRLMAGAPRRTAVGALAR